MKSKLVLLSIVATLIPLGTAVQDAAAEEIHVQASFYPYYDFTRNVAGSAATVEQFLPLGVEAHDWEPSISKVRSLYDTHVFVYTGLGIETYVDRLAQSDDLSHVAFVKASEGLVLISITGVEEMIRVALEEYEEGHYTAKEAVEAIEDILDDEEIREILEMYKSGDLTTVEALSAIQSLVGGGHGDHDDHGHDDHGHGATEDADDGHDDHGHETAEETEEHGHDEHAITEDIRSILEEIRDGDTGYEEGLEAIHDLVGSEVHGHDEHGNHDEHDHGAFDPHIWLDPVLVVQQVENIRDALMVADPDNAAIYEDNAAAYISKLDELHGEYATTLSNCQHDTIVTFHGAFTYLVERYGFETVSLSGISGTETVSTANIVNMVEYVQANDIRYLLGDDVLDTRALEVIAEETEAQVLTLSPIEGISPDEFESATYLGKMRSNLDVLKIALACQ
jgi:zinc transport system substrate-binding protein